MVECRRVICQTKLSPWQWHVYLFYRRLHRRTASQTMEQNIEQLSRSVLKMYALLLLTNLSFSILRVQLSLLLAFWSKFTYLFLNKLFEQQQQDIGNEIFSPSTEIMDFSNTNITLLYFCPISISPQFQYFVIQNRNRKETEISLQPNYFCPLLDNNNFESVSSRRCYLSVIGS